MSIISELDKHLIWHPFTQEKIAPEVIEIKKALGAYIYDHNNKAYLDLISSWWVNIHGHADPKIAKSIYKQAKTLEHVVFAGFTHEPAVKLCKNLKTILPIELSKFFFSDNGSTAVEVAIKMAYQYWLNIGNNERNIFLSFEGGYHGDTFGAMSVGARSGFHDKFTDLLFKVLPIPYPETWDNDLTVELKEANALKVLVDYLDQYGNKIAAIILEPLIQGASGMRICRADFIKKIINLVRQNNILVIFDEVMTGFGRTGRYFAMEHLDLIPDFLCISKGITGGFLPLALTITTEQIYTAFLGDNFSTAFAHGHSYTANPLACSAAITSLKLLKSIKSQNAIKSISKAHQEGLKLLQHACPTIEKTRFLGTIAAFNLKNPENIQHLKKQFLAAGMLLRPLGNAIYLLPPYCILASELELVYSKIAGIINQSN